VLRSGVSRASGARCAVAAPARPAGPATRHEREVLSGALVIAPSLREAAPGASRLVLPSEMREGEKARRRYRRYRWARARRAR
jgi:hypothetical protein